MSEYEEIRARPTHGLNETFLVRDTLRIVCECGEQSCIEQLEIEPAAYETLRADPTLFAVKPGHEVPALETVVERKDGWLPERTIRADGALPVCRAARRGRAAARFERGRRRRKVTPHPGIELTLEQRHGSGWLSVGDKPVRADGAFSFVAAPTTPGLATYLVVTARGTEYVGSSARVRVRVLHLAVRDSTRPPRTASSGPREEARVRVPRARWATTTRSPSTASTASAPGSTPTARGLRRRFSSSARRAMSGVRPQTCPLRPCPVSGTGT